MRMHDKGEGARTGGDDVFDFDEFGGQDVWVL